MSGPSPETGMDDRTARRPWRIDIDAQGVAWLRFDAPGESANTLSEPAMQDLDGRLGELERMDPAPRAVIVCSGKPRGFIAGADIREFSKLDDPARTYELVRSGQRVLDRLEALPCPTVAAINGFALGGGLELALACTYRVAADSDTVRLGLPEVMLGIHPGFGGTVRAVRLLGAPVAMDMMLTGRRLNPGRALSIGLVDRLAPPQELERTAAQLALAPPRRRRMPLRARLLNLAPVRPIVAAQMRKQVARRARREHYPAPYALIDLWARHGANPRTGYDAEARSIAALFSTPTSRNLVRVYFLQERLKGLGAATAKAGRVHVIGAGVMGGDIAAWCALRGIETTVQDRGLEYVTPAIERARELFEKRIRDPQERAQAAARLTADVAGHALADADVILEAISENVVAKRALYAQIEPRMRADTILATNTSSLMLETLGQELADPGRLVGLHFFNPVAKMPLVEVVHGEATRPEVLERALAFTRQIDKLPLPCRSAPGFVVNRILTPYMMEAMHCARDGIPLPAIDLAATRFGMPMGPVELADTVGLDVALNVGRILAASSGRTAPDELERLVAAGKLGRKSGEGFYRWQDGKPVKPALRDEPADAELEDRLILPMLNEAVAVLRERIVADGDLLDAGVIFGTGFAPFRGGPLAYSRARGIDRIVARLHELATKHGDRFAPDAGWQLLA